MLAPGTVKLFIRLRRRKQIGLGKYGLVAACRAT
jgi:hypothetical protein